MREPTEAQKFRAQWIREYNRPDDACVFFTGYRGYCGSEIENSTSRYCEEHDGLACWHDGCEKQVGKSCAIQECDIVECRYHPHYEEH